MFALHPWRSNLLGESVVVKSLHEGVETCQDLQHECLDLLHTLKPLARPQLRIQHVSSSDTPKVNASTVLECTRIGRPFNVAVFVLLCSVLVLPQAEHYSHVSARVSLASVAFLLGPVVQIALLTLGTVDLVVRKWVQK